MPRLFALDQNFPQPLVHVLGDGLRHEWEMDWLDCWGPDSSTAPLGEEFKPETGGHRFDARSGRPP